MGTLTRPSRQRIRILNRRPPTPCPKAYKPPNSTSPTRRYRGTEFRKRPDIPRYPFIRHSWHGLCFFTGRASHNIPGEAHVPEEKVGGQKIFPGEREQMALAVEAGGLDRRLPRGSRGSHRPLFRLCPVSRCQAVDRLGKRRAFPTRDRRKRIGCGADLGIPRTGSISCPVPVGCRRLLGSGFTPVYLEDSIH